MFRRTVDFVHFYVEFLSILLQETFQSCPVLSFKLVFKYIFQVKMRILMGTYALSAGYYDAYYKRAQQVPLTLIL